MKIEINHKMFFAPRVIKVYARCFSLDPAICEAHVTFVALQSKRDFNVGEG